MTTVHTTIARVGARNDHTLLTAATCQEITDKMNAEPPIISNGGTMVPGSARFDGRNVTIRIQLPPGKSIEDLTKPPRSGMSLADKLIDDMLLQDLK